MLQIILFLVAGLGSHAAKNEISQQVDLIELNHFYDDLGRHAYDQVIFYEWSPDYRRHDVIAWRLVERFEDYPKQNFGVWSVRWLDSETFKIKRLVTSRQFRETISFCRDPERENKQLRDERFRSGLMKNTVSILER